MITTDTPTLGITPEPVRPLSVTQYHSLIRHGELDDENVELLEGWLVEQMTKDIRHIAATRRVRKRLELLAPSGWLVDTQEPLTTIDSEPEPDAMVVRGCEADFDNRKVNAVDVALVVEVSETSLARDRNQKQRIYAKAEIPVYWIVNVVDAQLEVFTEPDGVASYRNSQVLKPGENVQLVLDDQGIGVIPVVELFPVNVK
ncbi:MAG: hypothetical protein CMJ78_03305 [Planctomycetaceae bacterium]|nr:hypothetical protein [Planctomycetaceae bacterium]